MCTYPTLISPVTSYSMNKYKHTILATQLTKQHKSQVIRSWQLVNIATEAENVDSDYYCNSMHA